MTGFLPVSPDSTNDRAHRQQIALALNALQKQVAALQTALKVPTYTIATLPTPSPVAAGYIAFATDGRANGEGAGAGTGVLCFYDGTAWRACDTGQTAAA